MYEKIILGGKRVYVVENHQEVLLPWTQEYRENGNRAYTLLTLDHHTDTHRPFIHTLGKDDGHLTERIQAEINNVDITDDISIAECVRALKNDQQIQAAIMLGIVKNCFVISHDGVQDRPVSIEKANFVERLQAVMMRNAKGKSSDFSDLPTEPARPFTYSKPQDHIFIVGHHKNANSITDPIEDIHLNKRIEIMHEMASSSGTFQSLFEEDYLLDIDLDYFHTMKSINPTHWETLKRLIRQARAITLATEPKYVYMNREDGETDSQLLLDAMKSLILKATAAG